MNEKFFFLLQTNGKENFHWQQPRKLIGYLNSLINKFNKVNKEN